MTEFPSRQVHLDFHTSEHMPGVGAVFSKENFQKALMLGRINSITIFAKCHHSWSYYPTKVGRVHPTLKFDLAGAMIEAAHEIGVRAPVYITVGWSANDAKNHPEWVVRNKGGNIVGSSGFKADARPEDKRDIVSWAFLCPNGGYADLIYEQTREICDLYPQLDGLFYDICFGPLCWCETCEREMKEAGLNPDQEEDARTYHKIKWQRFTQNCTRILREKHKDATIFFNGGANPYEACWHEWQTHFEMEDLPTTWGGYDKLPLRAKYFARSGKPYIGQTGKFHTMWGEFGGFKPSAALRYEFSAMLAYGARCEVGDQMHPCGEMDMETYRLIGEAYEYVEKIEPWCFGTEETTRLGIMLSGQKESDEGLVKILLEKQLDFDIVLPEDDLKRFDVIILPDCIHLDEEASRQLNGLIENGGGVLLTGTSGLNKGETHFVIDAGVNYQGKALHENDYVLLNKQLSEGIVNSPFLFYTAGEKVWLTDGEVLASIKEPYFNRTVAHYCSHQNTPYKLETASHPAAVRKGNVVYLAHPVCSLYYAYGAQFHRDYFINALRLIYRQPVLQVDLPSSGRAHFVRQTANNRYVLHLLYATPIQRGRALVIEDMPPIFNVDVTMQISEKVKRAYLAPQGDILRFKQQGNTVTLTVPKVECHQIVVLDY